MEKIWTMPEIQQMNRLPMRSPLIPYSNEKAALAEAAAGPENIDFTKSEFTKCLDGKWKFFLQQTADAEVDSSYKDWTESSFNDRDWREINVPGTWTLQNTGDFPHYTNVQMPWTILPPNVPQKNPTGLYRLQCEIPAAWKNRRVVIHIGSAESCLLLYVNGKFAGASKDTRLPCEFDITDFLQWKGEKCTALVAIKVVRYSDASFVEDQDQWWFGGIHRSVYLYSTENIFIKDIKALTTADGKIPLRVEVGISRVEKEFSFNEKGFEAAGVGDAAKLIQKNVAAKYSIYELDGLPSKGIPGKLLAQGSVIMPLDYRENLFEIRKDIQIKKPRLWSSEEPNLYLALVSLHESDGKKTGRLIESTAFTFGFKEVEVRDRKLLLNGKTVYIHGVNRHEHSETHGKTLTTAEMLRDIKTMKAYNFNAVRTCHYPDDERWYELCSRYGLYVLDEANIENHCYYDAMSRDDSWAASYSSRVQRTFRRDKNFACVFGWSLGNESGNGQNHVANVAWLRAVDKTRLVHYEGFVREAYHQKDFTLDSLANGKGLTDLISPMYPPIDLIVEYAKTRDDYRPIIMCEYSHAMGNANGSLADYWRAIESTPGLQGGFIWDWIDQGIRGELPAGKNGSPQGGAYWKYGGDFGDAPSDYDFCLNGINFPDQSPKPAMEECRYLFAPVRLLNVHAEQGLFAVENHADFLPLLNIELHYEILLNGRTAKSGIIKMSKIAPNQKAAIEIPAVPKIAAAASEDQEVILRADFVYSNKTPFAEKGSLVRRDAFVVRRATKPLSFFNCGANGAGNAKAKNAPLPLEDLRELVKCARPELFRALLENEGVKRDLPHLNDAATPWCFFGKPTRDWLNSGIHEMKIVEKGSGKAELLSPENALNKISFGTFSIKTEEVTLPAAANQAATSNLTAVNLTAIKLTAVFRLSKKLSEYPRAGIVLPVSADFSTVRWYGQGPHECYADRADSAKTGLYEMPIADLEVPYIVPQENGSRCGTYYIELCAAHEKRTLHIQSQSPITFSVQKYSTKDLFQKEHVAELSDLTKAPKNPHWELHIDAAHRGVGTGACGPDTLEQYRVRPGVYKLELLIW